MKAKHQKHANIVRPNYGEFGRNEVAIIGTPCGNIQKLAIELTKVLSKKWKVAYVDADHKSADDAETNGVSSNSAFENGAFLEYTDKITFHRFDSKAKLDRYQYRIFFNESDLVLVNGNHFRAKKQIVVIDPKKEESLKRKLDRLTDVQVFLFVEGVTQIPSFLKEHIPNYKEIPNFQFTDFQKVSRFLDQQQKEDIPPLYGLVLAGGKSTRMGQDKGAINYHGKPQRQFAYELLDKFCKKTFLSCRSDQVKSFSEDFPIIEDSFLGLGPFGAILSAFKKYPERAWLVIACDLPMLNKDSIQFLIKNRNASSIATTFHSPVTNFPEPLITIWEPKSYPILYQFLAQGYACPRKVLINSEITLLNAPNPQVLQNVNTPEERAIAIGLLENLKR